MTDEGTGLPLIRPDWNAPPAVRVVCTTRAGGVGASPYDTLNLGLHVGDEGAVVHENRRRLARALALPSAPLWLRQVHGTDIVDPDADPDAAAAGEARPVADGAMTARPGRVLAVLSADCLPVVVTDAGATRIAVVHAGWRGLAGGIVRRAIGRFPVDTTLHVWLGPAIGPDAFEVGEEVRAAFVARERRHARAFRPGATSGKYLADLYRLARGEIAAVARAGTVAVSGGGHCTLGEADRFFSHRRDGERTGRMATLAWIGSVEP